MSSASFWEGQAEHHVHQWVLLGGDKWGQGGLFSSQTSDLLVWVGKGHICICVCVCIYIYISIYYTYIYIYMCVYLKNKYVCELSYYIHEYN